MPFAVPWTAAAPTELPANMVRHFAGVRAGFGPDKFDLLFAVRVGWILIGVQAFHAAHFAVTRTAETGSWLGLRHQGKGYGTRSPLSRAARSESRRHSCCGFSTFARSSESLDGTRTTGSTSTGAQHSAAWRDPPTGTAVLRAAIR